MYNTAKLAWEYGHSVATEATQCKQIPIVQFSANQVVVVTFMCVRDHTPHIACDVGVKHCKRTASLYNIWEHSRCHNFNSKNQKSKFSFMLVHKSHTHMGKSGYLG